MTDDGSRTGLYTAVGTPIPLRAVDLVGEVIGGSVRMKVRQKYENVESKPLEAIYTFPLPTDATLVGFVMESDGRRIEGVVKERDEAFKTYDDAMLEGHGAALLDQERSNVFTASVGNLLANETTVVEVEYVQRLRADEGALRLMIPTLVAPRYIPGKPGGDRSGHGAADPTDRVPDADRISPKIGAADYTVSLDLSLRLGEVEVSSPSHALTVTKGDVVHVSFANGRVPLDRDIVVLAEGARDQAMTTVVTHRDETSKEGTFVLSHVVDLFSAGLGQEKAPLDVVFLIDRSGSMGGLSIEEARKALRLCLRQLREGDRFSIIAFDDREDRFEQNPVPFTQKTLQRADAWIASIDARGGTELREPLLSATALAKDGIVVLLTDGQVGNEDEILAAVLEKRATQGAKARIYTFGIGTNVSDALLSQLSKKSGGALEMIHPGERIDEKVVATFARAIAPRVRDVRVTWEGIEANDLAPSAGADGLPDLVDGEPWVLFGRYDKECSGRVAIRGTLGGTPWVLELPITLPASADAPSVTKLWAAERVRDLEAVEVEGRRAKAMKDRIVALATAHGIASKYTSFVVVETRTGDRRVRDGAAARPIPVHAPHGWAMTQPQPQLQRMMYASATGGYGGAPGGFGPPPPPMAPPMMPMSRSAPMSAAAPPSPAMAAAPKKKGSLLQRARGAIGAMFDAPSDGAGPMGSADEGAPALREEEELEVLESAAPMGDPIFAILSRQLASGLFDEAPSKGVGEKDDELRLVQATTRALVELLKLGVDASHRLHGEVVKKTVQALVPLAQRIAPRAKALAEQALAVAWIAAAGKRTRRVVDDAARTVGFDELALRTADEATLRASVLA